MYIVSFFTDTCFSVGSLWTKTRHVFNCSANKIKTCFNLKLFNNDISQMNNFAFNLKAFMLYVFAAHIAPSASPCAHICWFLHVLWLRYAPSLAPHLDELHVTLCVCVGSSTSVLEMCCACVLVHTPAPVLVFWQSPVGVLNEPFPLKDAVWRGLCCGSRGDSVIIRAP